jgi:mannosyltransferase
MSAARSRFRFALNQLSRIGNSVWLALILILAITLRLLQIDANSLWFDEAFSWIVARQPASAILTQQLTPIMPPLYHLLLSFWMPLGETEVVLRSFSAICGVTTIPVMYFLGLELFNSAVGLAAALLTAVLPFHVYFAQQARPYALVILLSALMLWAFVRSWKGAGYGTWISFGLLSGFGLYAHYFVIFPLAVLHGFVLLRQRRRLHGWRGLFLSDLVAIVVFSPRLPSAWAQTRQVTTDFWLSTPSPLQPIKTLDYLLFSHTTPLWLTPVALFLTLSIFMLVIWGVFRVHGEARQWLFLLFVLVLAPMLLALLISWTIGPIYLDRSFSLVTPAYVLLLSWGLTNPPRSSPLPLLYGGLAVVAAISLGNHYLRPDPAKPPFREVGVVLRANWQENDVLLNLHDSSYLPLRYYAPELQSYLLNNDPDTWVPAYTWEWAGHRISSLDEVVIGKSRLWLVIMPGRGNDRQMKVLARIESRYKMEREWAWPSVDSVKLRLYRLEDGGADKSSARHFICWICV